jgi:hypothetical protein
MKCGRSRRLPLAAVPVHPDRTGNPPWRRSDHPQDAHPRELYLLGEATRRPGAKVFVDASRGCNLVFFADASARRGNVVSRLCGIAA